MNLYLTWMKRLAIASLLLASANASAFVLHGNKWGPGPMGTGATVSYSFMATGTGCDAEFIGCTITSLDDFMPAGWKAEVDAAFAAWSAVADLTFIEVVDDGSDFNAPTGSGDIRIGGHAFDGPGSTLAHGYFPPPNGNSAAGDIHFDVADNWKVGFGGPGFDIFTVMAHEIGHALGLRHTDVPGSLLNPFYTEAFSGPQADDIAGMVAIYGEAQPTPAPAGLVLLMLGLVSLLAGRRVHA